MNPSKLKDIGKLLAKYPKREFTVYKTICEKYEVEETPFATLVRRTDVTPTAPAQASSASGSQQATTDSVSVGVNTEVVISVGENTEVVDADVDVNFQPFNASDEQLEALFVNK